MPIMATLRRTLRGTVVSDDNRALDFRSIDGSHTVSWDGVNLRVLASAKGLDVPPRELQRDSVPGLPGSRLRSVRDLEREVFLPLLVSADREDWRGLNARLAEIRSFMDFRLDPNAFIEQEGSFDLVATTDGQERRLRCSYLDGMGGEYGEDTALPEWRMFGLSLLAVNPYWRGEQWSTPTVGLPTPAPFLSSNPADAWPRKLSPSVAIGADMPLSIPGDVPSPAGIELLGPSSSTHVTSPSGLDVTIGPLDADDVFVLETGRTKRALLNGEEAWGKIGQSPRWPALRPGQTTISITMTGASAASRARVYGDSLWETAW